MATEIKPRRKAQAIMAVWGVAIFGIFCFCTRPLTASAWSTLGTLGLGVLCGYALALKGFQILRRWGGGIADEADPVETCSIELGLGALACMVSVLACGTLGILRPWAAWSLLGLGLVGPHGAFLAALSRRQAEVVRERGSTFLLVILFAAGAMTLAQSLAPVTCQDALVYHLALPAKYVEAGGLVKVDGSFFASFPQYVEMLFTLGLLLRGESLAQWFHWALGVLACLSAAGLARRLSRKSSRLLAAAAFGTIPTVTLIAGWAYVDLGVVSFILLSTTLFLRWVEKEDSRSLIFSALFAGAAAGCKYTGGLQGLLIAVGALVLGWSRRRGLAWSLRRTMTFAALTGLVACPWWIRNLVQTGNPLFPFFFGIFGGEGWDNMRASTLSVFLQQWGGQGGLAEAWLLPWRLTFSAQFFSEEAFDGMIGAAFLMGAPLILSHVWKGSSQERILGGFALLHAIFWTVTTQQVRFLLPSLGMIAALLAVALERRDVESFSMPILRHCVAAAFGWNVIIASFYFAHHNPLPVVLGLESRSAYMAREIPCGDYPVFEAIERELPADSNILFGSLGNPGFLSKRRYHSDAIFENRTLSEILHGARDAAAAYKEFRARGFTHLLFRFQNVFDPTGKKSDLPPGDQEKLGVLLNEHARLVAQANGTLLYELAR